MPSENARDVVHDAGEVEKGCEEGHEAEEDDVALTDEGPGVARGIVPEERGALKIADETLAGHRAVEA